MPKSTSTTPPLDREAKRRLAHLLDDTRYDAPTFNENCGQSSMSLKVNSGSMSLDNFYEAFLKKFRIIDKDRYTLDPGDAWFKGCDTTKADLVRTMAKP